MDFHEAIQFKSHEFLTLCRDHNVRELYVFGSSSKQNSNRKPGDVDLLVELSTEDPIKRGEDLLNLWEKFEVFFQSKVDLLTAASIRNPVLKKAIDSSKVLVYDGKDLKISF
jgi:predicted nucleotidyltransferase